MSCLFVHDFRAYCKDGQFYTGNLSYNIWRDRYIRYFGEINVLNRTSKLLDDSKIEGYILSSGENLHFLNEIHEFSGFDFIFNYRSYCRIVNTNVDANEYVIIRLDSFLGIIASKYCRKKEKKYLIECVGCVWDSFWNKGILGKIVAFPLFLMMRNAIWHAPYVVYVTESFLQKRYPTKGVYTNISNVELPEIDGDILERRLKRIDSYQNDAVFHIVTVASVSVRYKGQDSVIKALARQKKLGKNNYIYHLIGDGDQSYLLNFAKHYGVSEQVQFHGPMQHSKVIEFLDSCDIYIQPSKQEGLPRALIEAMSRGLTCFGSNIAGIPELLPENQLFSPGLSAPKSIARLLGSCEKEQMRQSARRNIENAQKYSRTTLENRRKEFFTRFQMQQ